MPVIPGGSGGVQGQSQLHKKLEVIIPETLFEKQKQKAQGTWRERGRKDSGNGRMGREARGGALSPAYGMTLQM